MGCSNVRSNAMAPWQPSAGNRQSLQNGCGAWSARGRVRRVRGPHLRRRVLPNAGLLSFAASTQQCAAVTLQCAAATQQVVGLDSTDSNCSQNAQGVTTLVYHRSIWAKPWPTPATRSWVLPYHVGPAVPPDRGFFPRPLGLWPCHVTPARAWVLPLGLGSYP
jgi:hypothetical protein